MDLNNEERGPEALCFFCLTRHMRIIRALPAYTRAVTEEKSHSRGPSETALLGKNRSDQYIQGHRNCAGAGAGGYRASGRVPGKPSQTLGQIPGAAQTYLPPKHLGVEAGRDVQGHPQLHGEFEGFCHPKFILKSTFYDFCEHRVVLSASLRRLFCRNKQGLWVSDGSCSVYVFSFPQLSRVDVRTLC